MVTEDMGEVEGVSTKSNTDRNSLERSRKKENKQVAQMKENNK